MAFVFFLFKDFGSISVTIRSVKRSLSKSDESAPIEPKERDWKKFSDSSENVPSLLLTYK